MKIELAHPTAAPKISRKFANEGAIVLDHFLADHSAKAILTEMQSSSEWLEIFTAGGKTYEMKAADFDALSDADRKRISDLSHEAARSELQYRYRSIRVSEDPGERQRRDLAIDRFASMMNAASTIEYLREVTGLREIDFVDAQATAYRAGDFLTNHDDDVSGKNRLAAYVLSLTPEWSMDWGGLLLLEDDEGVRGFSPVFNSLRVFAVPRNHCVSIVAPWVPETRYSITGWLRRSVD